VFLGRTGYFLDERLKEMREMKDPTSRIDLSSIGGFMVLQALRMTLCPRCGLELGIVGASRLRRRRCPCCGLVVDVPERPEP
jgi:hypothetical protein